MRENNYQKLAERIMPPAGLNDQVLVAARQQARQETGPKRLLPRRKHPALRAAVCGACALALVLGTLTLYPSGSNEEQRGGHTPGWSFGLTAYAAETGESYGMGANGGIAFTVGEGMASQEAGDYTGCLFQITGSGIETVSLSIDRGGLYRYRLRENLTEVERAEARRAMEEGGMTSAAISQREDGAWYLPEMTVLGGSVTEEYDPTASYGFWVPPEDYADQSADLQEQRWENIDLFDGANLTVTATFSDGSAKTEVYHLSTGRLRMTWDEDGAIKILPGLAGDEEAYIYGIYAASESESHWLQWPVQGANTVRISNSYGKRWQPGGETAVAHNGIDIPAQEGTTVLAAMDGMVREIGFDAQRGNYLVLDHGGGLETLYAQCRDLCAELKEGDAVKAGETLGTVGATGMATGPHLHFEVLQDGKSQNPEAYFDSDIRDNLRLAE